MKKCLFFTFIIFYTSLFSEIHYKIVSPMKFRKVNTTHLDKDKVLGEATIEIYTDNEAEDLGKMISIKFPEYNLLTNRRRWIKVEKIAMEDKEKEFILTKERVEVKVYGILDRRVLNRGEEVIDIEGEYIGYLPLIISQYKKRGGE
ncbi:MAG: hypothetical protein ACRC7S_08190 [Cetobacterium sp.]